MDLNLLPKSFIEAIAGVFALSGVLCSAISLFPKSRNHLLKIFVYMTIASLAMFANDTLTFFLAITLIAAAVIEVEFIQNIVAIIRGGDSYFKFRAELMNKFDVEDKTTKEQNEQIKPLTQNEESTKRATSIRQIMEYETKAISKLQQDLGYTIERNLRLTIGSQTFEVDGFAKTTRGGKKLATIVEVIYLRRGSVLIQTGKLISRLERVAHQYFISTGIQTSAIIVLVLENKNAISEQQTKILSKKISNSTFIERLVTYQAIALESLH